MKNSLRNLKGLSFRQKVRFCLDYYKGYLFVLLVGLLILFYVGDMVYQSRQVIDLQGFFVNDQYNLFPAKELMEEFSVYRETPAGHRIAFEDSLFVDLNSGTEYHAASQSKIVAYISAKELDFIVAPEELAKYYAQSFVLCDLETLIPEELKEDLLGDLYYAEDGTGVHKACGLNLKDSGLLKKAKEEGTLDEDAEDYYLMVLGYTERGQAVSDFIRFVYEDRER